MIDTCRVGALLDSLGFPIPSLPPPTHKFEFARKVGCLVFVSSCTPRMPDGTEICGKLRNELDIDSGKEAARWCVVNSLAALRSVVPDLSTIDYVADLMCFLNATAGFVHHSDVADGASELLQRVFGDRGKHTRAAIGAHSLVRDVTVVVKATYVIHE